MLFLQELRDVWTACQGPWLVMGDFNLIVRQKTRTMTTWIGLWWVDFAA
jgi:hypothetical protein